MHVIYEVYQRNASKLAIDLCSTDERTAETARKSIKLIGHAQHSLSDWLAFEWSPNRLFPIVVEKGFDSMEDQTDDGMIWLFNATHYEPLNLFEKRAAYALNHKEPVDEHMAHSSASIKERLVPEAERCLEKYYAEDYTLIRKIKEQACKTENCKLAIQQILDQRTGN